MTDVEAPMPILDKVDLSMPGGHTRYICGGKCEGRHCQFCDGGLTACSVCGAFEGAWTTDCPRVDVPYDLWQRVYHGEMDYTGGRWLAQPSPVASPYGRQAVMAAMQAQAEALGWDHIEFFGTPPERDRPNGLMASTGGYLGGLEDA